MIFFTRVEHFLTATSPVELVSGKSYSPLLNIYMYNGVLVLIFMPSHYAKIDAVYQLKEISQY